MTKMTVNAVAIWNDEDGCWDIDVVSNYNSNDTATPIDETRAGTYKIGNCDEFAIPWAILQHDGISTELIEKALEAYEG